MANWIITPCNVARSWHWFRQVTAPAMWHVALESWQWIHQVAAPCNSFRRTHYWTPKIKDGWDPPSWISTWRHFFCWGWSDLDNISQTGAEWHVDCGDMVKIETRCRIPIWRTFGRITWDVIVNSNSNKQISIAPYASYRCHVVYCLMIHVVVWMHDTVVHCR